MQQLSSQDKEYLITFLEDAIYASQTCIEVLNYRYADQGMHKHAKTLYRQIRAHCHLTGSPWPMNDSLHENPRSPAALSVTAETLSVTAEEIRAY